MTKWSPKRTEEGLLELITLMGQALDAFNKERLHLTLSKYQIEFVKYEDTRINFERVIKIFEKTSQKFNAIKRSYYNALKKQKEKK